MKARRRRGRARLAVAALLAVGAASRTAPAAAATPDPWREVWGYGEDPLRVKYEELFDQSFPARGYDPFHRAHPFYEVQQFNRAFDLRTSGVSWRVDRGGDAVALLVSWPGSSERALDVSVDRGLVKVRPASGSAEPPSRYRFRSARAEELDVPLPPSADARSAKVTREGDVIRVTFAVDKS